MMPQGTAPVNATFFAPHLAIKVLRPAIEFYKNAFGAKVLNTWENEGIIHVAEMEIEGCMFHLHEETTHNKQMSPDTLNGTTVVIGLFVKDPDKLFNQAVKAGAIVSSPMQDYEYGYRQGSVVDPWGHQWMVERRV